MAFCLSVLLVSGAALSSEVETSKAEAVDILTIIENKDALLGCTTTPAACSRLAGRYGYPYYYAEVDYDRCYYDYPYACYGIN